MYLFMKTIITIHNNAKNMFSDLDPKNLFKINHESLFKI